MRYENNKRIRNRRIFRIKKAMAVFIAFFIVFVFATVDRNCGEMVGNDAKIIPVIVCEKPGVIKIKWSGRQCPVPSLLHLTTSDSRSLDK